MHNKTVLIIVENEISNPYMYISLSSGLKSFFDNKKSAILFDKEWIILPPPLSKNIADKNNILNILVMIGMFYVMFGKIFIALKGKWLFFPFSLSRKQRKHRYKKESIKETHRSSFIPINNFKLKIYIRLCALLDQ